MGSGLGRGAIRGRRDGGGSSGGTRVRNANFEYMPTLNSAGGIR
jgi:hypothetical protein